MCVWKWMHACVYMCVPIMKSTDLVVSLLFIFNGNKDSEEKDKPDNQFFFLSQQTAAMTRKKKSTQLHK